MGVNYNPKIVTDGLVLHLDAANPKSYPGSGTTWFDLSGNGNNATLMNGVANNFSNNGVMSFDGSDDYVNTELIPQSSNVTFSFIIKPLLKNTFRTIFFTGSNWINNYSFYLRPSDNAGFAWNVNSANNRQGSWFVNNWYIVCLTWDGSVALTYVNGKIISSYNYSGVVNASNLRIGVTNNSSISSFIGDMPVFQYYSRSLTEQEVQQNFNATRSRYGI